MKKHEIIFSTIKLPLDFIIIFISFFLAREIRLKTDLIPGLNLPIQTINTQDLFPFAIIGSLLYLLLFAIHNLYKIQITSSKVKEFLDIIRYSFYRFIFFLVIIFLGKEIIYKIEIPRLIVLFTFIVGTTLVILQRILLNNLQYSLLKKNIILKKKLVIINNKNYEEIKDIIKDIKESRVYEIIGYINKNPNNKISKIKYLGGEKQLEKMIEKNNCDEILYIESDLDKKELFNLWDLSKTFGIRYRYITNSFDITKTNTTMSLINSIPVIEFKNTPLVDSWGRVIKRSFDIIVSIFGIIIFFPFMLIIGIIIKTTDPKGPIIYKNKRVGQKGKNFNLYKFRYMKWDYCIKDSYGVSEKKDNALKYEKKLIDKKTTRSGPLYKIKNDPRKTKIGDFMERYSIDELPQLYNVIIGNMSLVGPRPHQPREVKNYKIRQKRLLTIKPGITGMAQVNGREKNNFEDEAKLDIFYIENWGMILDLKIIFKTLGIIFNKR